MKTWTAPLVLAAIVAAAQPATAQSARSYFPLQQGNSWTHQHQTDEMETYVSVSDAFNGIYQVSGIPGAQSGLWVTWGGSTLYAWRPSTLAWVQIVARRAVHDSSSTRCAMVGASRCDQTARLAPCMLADQRRSVLRTRGRCSPLHPPSTW